MNYLVEKYWNPKQMQYEIGEKLKVKIWSCKDKMKCEKESCKIEDVNMKIAKGMVVQIIGNGRQSKRTIPSSKLEMIGSTPKEFAELLVEDAIGVCFC